MASHGHGAIEVAKTVLEVAEVAWAATESYHHHHNHDKRHDHADLTDEEELQSARCENQRLRDLLEQNLKLLQNLSESPCFAKDCPPDVCILPLNLELYMLFLFNEIFNSDMQCKAFEKAKKK